MNFEDELTKGNFTIPECSSCKKIIWPPTEFCDVCHNKTCLKTGQFTGKIIEYSKQNEEYFCMVEFLDSFRLIAKKKDKPENGQIVKISKCGISEGSYFFQVI
jgi:uncharacterized OB-fold protein